MYAVHTTHKIYRLCIQNARLDSTRKCVCVCEMNTHIPMLFSTYTQTHAQIPSVILSFTHYFVRSQIGFSLPFVHWNVDDFFFVFFLSCWYVGMNSVYARVCLCVLCYAICCAYERVRLPHSLRRVNVDWISSESSNSCGKTQGQHIF